jgi:His/Glu/Gln/Arg/opine family amino acid ABC transporter permease subunit
LDVKILLDALTSKALREGLVLTLELTAVSFAIGIVLGLVMALLRGSRFRLVRAAAWTYIWVFRAIPTLVLLLFFWNGLPQLIPALKGPGYPAFLAATIALSVNEAAYAAEIFRGGLLSIDDGQRLAARALGMPPVSVFRRVVLPQLVRVVIPPAANDFITMLKLTSLASVVSLREILTSTQSAIATTFRFAEWYTATAIYYLVLVSIFMVIQAWLERRYIWLSQRGDRGAIPFLRTSTAAR